MSRPMDVRALAEQLLIACSVGDVPRAEELLPLLEAQEEAQLKLLAANISDEHGQTPLLHASKRAATAPVVERLLKLGADPDTHVQPSLNSCLHLAALHSPLRGQPSIAKLLVQHGCNIDARNVNGDTPLMFACGAGNLGTAAILLKAGAAPHTCNKEGLSPLLIAAGSGSEPAILLLLRALQSAEAQPPQIEDGHSQPSAPSHLTQSQSGQQQSLGDAAAALQGAQVMEGGTREGGAEPTRGGGSVLRSAIQHCDVHGNSALHFAARDGGLHMLGRGQELLVNFCLVMLGVSGLCWKRERTLRLNKADRTPVVEAKLNKNVEALRLLEDSCAPRESAFEAELQQQQREQQQQEKQLPKKQQSTRQESATVKSSNGDSGAHGTACAGEQQEGAHVCRGDESGGNSQKAGPVEGASRPQVVSGGGADGAEVSVGDGVRGGVGSDCVVGAAERDNDKNGRGQGGSSRVGQSGGDDADEGAGWVVVGKKGGKGEDAAQAWGARSRALGVGGGEAAVKQQQQQQQQQQKGLVHQRQPPSVQPQHLQHPQHHVDHHQQWQQQHEQQHRGHQQQQQQTVPSPHHPQVAQQQQQQQHNHKPHDHKTQHTPAQLPDAAPRASQDGSADDGEPSWMPRFHEFVQAACPQAGLLEIQPQHMACVGLEDLSFSQLEALEVLHHSALARVSEAKLELARVQERLKSSEKSMLEEELRQRRKQLESMQAHVHAQGTAS